MNKVLRKFFNDIHLWLGLLSSIVLFVVCLSGTIYTFHKEINEFFNKEKYTVSAFGVPTSVDELATGLENSQTQVNHITIPANKEKAWTFSLKNKGKSAREAKDKGKQVMVDPYTAKITGTAVSKTNDFFTTMMKLHRWLLLDQPNGRIVVGIATIIFILLLVSGIVLWIPKKLKRWRNWKAGFKIKFSGKWKRINHDLHNTLGFYSFLLLLVMACTGLCWSFEWYKDGMSHVLGDKVFKHRTERPLPSTYVENTQFISISEALTIADKALPFAGNVSVSLPADSLGSYSISKTRNSFFALSMPDKITIDCYSGKVLQLEKFADKKFLHKLAASIKPLHTGEIFGIFSKILYFIACLVATSLPVTGIVIWLNKMRKK